MLAARLHPGCGDNPGASLEVNLRPTRTDDFSRARRGQNGELKRPRRDIFAHAQLSHEGSDLRPRQCGIVVALGNRPGRWQHTSEVPLPAGWIIAAAVTPHGCPIQHALDAPANAVCCLGFAQPDRFHNAQHCRRVDRRDRHVAQHRVGVAGKRREKLLAMLCVAPLLLVQGVVGLCGRFERHDLRCLGALSPSSIDWVNPVKQLQPGRSRPLARILERDRVQRSQAEPAFASVALKAQLPTRIVGVDHDQDQAMSVVVSPGALHQRSHPFCGELHSLSQLATPGTSTGLATETYRILSDISGPK